MRSFALMTALLVTSPALAGDLGRTQQGLDMHLGVGFGLDELPVLPALGWEMGIGWWRGAFDDEMLLGKYWGLGLHLRQDIFFHPDRKGIRSAPMLQARFGMELLGIGLSWGVAGGPVWRTEPPIGNAPSMTVFDGGTARLFGIARRAMTPNTLIYARLEAGVDITPAPELKVYPTFGILFGAEFRFSLTPKSTPPSTP